MNYKELTYKELQEWFDGTYFQTPPFKHQLASIAFALGEKLNRVMFAHDIGTGKTKIALDLTNLWRTFGRILIICPSSVTSTWEDEIVAHTDLSYTILTGSRKKRWAKLITEKADLWIINYEGLKIIGADKSKSGHIINPAYPKSLGFGCIVADECHKFKNYASLQAQIAQLFTKFAKHTILMTGTPFGRFVGDLFGQFYVLDNGETFGKEYHTFLRHYFYENEDKPREWLPKRVCNICKELYAFKVEHLYDAHKMTFQQYARKYPKKERTAEDIILDMASNKLIRYSIEECVDLPDKVYEIREVYPTNEQKSIANKILLGLNLDEINEGTVESHAQKFLQITSGFLIKEGKVIHNFKINPKIDEMLNVINEIQGKFLIFHHYTNERKLIINALTKNHIEYLEIPKDIKQRKQVLDKFKQSDTVRCLVAHPKTGGEGLNIQHAHTTIFYSNAFIGNILREQTEGRTFRTGQKKTCVYVDIIMKDTADAIMYRSLMNREDYIQNLLNYLKNIKKSSENT